MIARLFNEQLNISAAGDPVATQLSNLKISEDILYELPIIDSARKF